jgi:hypothetical protein
MKYLRQIVIGIGLLSFSLQGFSQDVLKNVKSTKRLAENVVTLVEQNSIDEAFKQLKNYWPLTSIEIDDLLAHTKEQRQIVTERFGKPLGIEFVRTELVGDSMVRHIFIEKFEKHGLRWQISFYKPADSWIVNSIYWDDKISELYS